MAQTIDGIKTTAAAIRDATEIGENTASRVGSSVYDLAVYAENTSSTLSPMVQEMYDEFTEARNAYYINLANVFSCVGHLCGSLNTDATPALKVTDEGEKGYSITLWQDGNTYRGANIPLSSAKNNGLMSAEQADDLATLWDNAVWSEDGKGLSTNDYTDADKAKLASISVPSSGIDLSALNSRIGMQSDNIFPPFDGMQSTAIILNTDTYDGEGTKEADAVMFYKTKLCFIASIGTRWYTRWKNLANVPDSTAYQYTYLNKRPLVHNSSRTLYVWDGDTSLLPITHQWQVLTSAQYEKLQYKDANTFYYILEDD